MPHVMLNTIVRNTYLGSKTANVTCSTNATLDFATATRPATNVASSAASIVFGSTCNYMKIHPWVSAVTGTPTIRVIGWSLCNDTRLWIPHSIAAVQVTAVTSGTGSSITLLGDTMFGASTLVKTAGDAKIFNPANTSTDAYFVVDSQGFELVELQFHVSTGTVKANAHIGDM